MQWVRKYKKRGDKIWQDIDFENSLIHVNKALLYRPDDQGMKKETIPTQSQR